MPLNEGLIQESLPVARKNWEDWRDVFEHSGSVATNPLLTDAGTFSAFCYEYRVHRTIRNGTQDELRRKLAKRLVAAVPDDSGQALDALEVELRPRFGTHNPPHRMISVLSKVAAFVRPERFVAWDRYGKKGLNLLLGRSSNASFDTYADYLAGFDCVWNGQAGQYIKDCVKRNSAQSKIKIDDSRFLRRVLDVCLMKIGDRKL